MAIRGRLGHLAYNTAAAVIGASAVFALLRSADIDAMDGPASPKAREPAARTDRLAFAKPGALDLGLRIARHAPDPAFRPTIVAERVDPRTDGAATTATPGAGRIEPARIEAAPIETASLGPASEAARRTDTSEPAWTVSTHTTAHPDAPSAQPRSATVSTEPAPRFQPLPSLRLPWQKLPWQTAGKAGVPRRTYTVKTRLAEIGPPAGLRLASRFEAAKVAWPPAEVALVAVKDQRLLELHARAKGGRWALVHRYRVLAASGGTGPKLRQGDKQVPEGLYSIASLNPNSAYHVSLRVNYPNAFDRQVAAQDGRKDLGGDIMIHGRDLSAGCLAMGDEAAEDLFVLAAQVGLPNVKLVIAPTDFRQAGVPAPAPGGPTWLPRLYADIATAMGEFKAPPKPARSLLSFFSE